MEYSPKPAQVNTNKNTLKKTTRMFVVLHLAFFAFFFFAALLVVLLVGRDGWPARRSIEGGSRSGRYWPGYRVQYCTVLQ